MPGTSRAVHSEEEPRGDRKVSKVEYPSMRTRLLAAVALLLTGNAVGRVSSAPVVAAQATSMAGGHESELRTYTATEGKLPNALARFRDRTRRSLSGANMKSTGSWA